LMPPATARPFAPPSPHAGANFTWALWSACFATLAAHIVPPAFVAATLVASHTCSQAFDSGPVNNRPDWCCHRRPAGNDTDRKKSKGRIDCLHRSTPFRFRQSQQTPTAAASSPRVWATLWLSQTRKILTYILRETSLSCPITSAQNYRALAMSLFSAIMIRVYRPTDHAQVALY
jgi:hypothetical protein